MCNSVWASWTKSIEKCGLLNKLPTSSLGKLDKKHRSILDKNVDLFKRYILVGAMEARWSWAKFPQLVWVEWRILDKNVDRFNDQNLDVVLVGQVGQKCGPIWKIPKGRRDGGRQKRKSRHWENQGGRCPPQVWASWLSTVSHGQENVAHSRLSWEELVKFRRYSSADSTKSELFQPGSVCTKGGWRDFVERNWPTCISRVTHAHKNVDFSKDP